MAPALLALVGAVAAGTSACRPGGARPSQVVALADSADQVIEGFSHLITRDGVRRGRIEADSAYFYERTQTMVLYQMRATFTEADGRETSQLRARKGIYRWQLGSWEAEGEVEFRSPAGNNVLRSEMLRYDEVNRKVATDVAFTYENGKDFIRGTSFTSDLDFKNVVTNQPRGRIGRGFALPGQAQ